MRTFITAAALVGTLLIAACNTVEGAGKDVASAGDTVANTAEKSK